MTPFKSYPSIPRLEKAPIRYEITEKIDGTNAVLFITRQEEEYAPGEDALPYDNFVEADDGIWVVRAGSRSRWLSPGKTTDNYGFAQWVADNSVALFEAVGPGLHYAEWWGQGIQRGYGQATKRFTLFNPSRYPCLPAAGGTPRLVDVVPTFSVGAMGINSSSNIDDEISWAIDDANYRGSLAAPGWASPEGLVVRVGDQLRKIILNHSDKTLSRDAA